MRDDPPSRDQPLSPDGLPSRDEPLSRDHPASRDEPSSAPDELWQVVGLDFCGRCVMALWAPKGERALAWLRGRGLHDETIRRARLGYNPVDRWDAAEDWGLSAGAAGGRQGTGTRKRVWLPRGVVIPWECGGELWRVNIRRPAGEPKYVQPAGGSVGLYGADALVPGRPAVLVEGEFDALTVAQAAGDLAAVVASGSTSGARRARWIARLALCSEVLVSFDADAAGESAAEYWLQLLRRARRWRVFYGVRG